MAATTAATDVDARCRASTCVMVRYPVLILCVARRPATRGNMRSVNGL